MVNMNENKSVEIRREKRVVERNRYMITTHIPYQVAEKSVVEISGDREIVKAILREIYKLKIVTCVEKTDRKTKIGLIEKIERSGEDDMFSNTGAYQKWVGGELEEG